MRIFVWEYLTSGACAGERWPESLLREGAAMLRALLSDIARIPDCAAVALWDETLGMLRLPGVEVVRIGDRNVEEARFRRLAGACDATLLIAPESAGVLAERRRWVDEAGGRAVGCTTGAIELCADKFRLANLLSERRIRTPETNVLGAACRESALPFPLVVKPRDGAGSQHTFLVHDTDELRRLPLPKGDWPSEFVCQPFVAGRALSTAAIVSAGGQRVEVFPVGAQRLSDDGRFAYLGGEIPAAFHSVAAPPVDGRHLNEAVQRLVQQVVGSVPGLEGYIGFDLVLPETPPQEPMIIEVNPRLTTAYAGYRLLAEDNLAERLLFPERDPSEIRWRGGRVVFGADGMTTDA